jgi:hypothetical protein
LSRSSALTAEAVSAVAQAASCGEVAVVEHGLPAELLGDDSELERLAARLPEGWILARDGEVPEVSGVRPTELGPVLPHHRETPVITRLYHVQRDPHLRELVGTVYDPLEAAWSEDEPWLERDAGFFLTRNGGTTTAHADRHHNLLLQLSGSKTVGLAVPGSADHARAVAASYPSLVVSRMPEPVRVVELRAGSALYMPPYTVHWVRSEGRSAALSCGWSSASTINAARVHGINAKLLRLGVPPAPVGSHRGAAAVRAAGAVRRLRRAATRS